MSPQRIHPSAIVDPSAVVADEVEIGPYAIIGAGVELAPSCVIGPHAVLRGPTRIGAGTRVFQFASVGEDPQDKKYAGEPTSLVIGARNVIRECATIHRGTVQDKRETRIGDDNLFMAYTHVAHDCVIGNNVIMANAASLGGHVEVQDWAILGGFSIVHQFCRIGAHSFSAMGTVIAKDVPPYLTIGGHPAQPRGINAEGLRRRAFSAEAIAALRRAYRLLYLANLKLADAVGQIRELAKAQPELAPLADFVADSTRSIVR
ncbi:acyl-[acyl-carrier-protein]--UDP-N-acetylglucosamine O-acyltransferase [Thiohalocapsa halophila]|uniref:Acyl-[acyl-carrier-protein]--UDP-N-acetylglucosamine O-acyltransferase n=1 Tax=Thiohalocapsa halophila TaxID=69359 RepID=A0ABS1CG58_9GAMM|nr:acyl-ACP--UDP-N-acetylglucosamine O-acyltransferase [Thiohalocapsa halophila]MBK1630718.1 acyl-[acyl-carrier-protein]--UDP-N-acetylglucosamine O-acyltransferase [Thiohalocapsa halophila]